MTTYEYLNLLASYGGLTLLYYGIRVMSRGAEMRSADSERKHTETMTESDRRHNEFMEDSERKHNESMAVLRALIDGQAESQAALRESIDGQAESRMALRELIERTR